MQQFPFVVRLTPFRFFALREHTSRDIFNFYGLRYNDLSPGKSTSIYGVVFENQSSSGFESKHTGRLRGNTN